MEQCENTEALIRLVAAFTLLVQEIKSMDERLGVIESFWAVPYSTSTLTQLFPRKDS